MPCSPKNGLRLHLGKRFRELLLRIDRGKVPCLAQKRAYARSEVRFLAQVLFDRPRLFLCARKASALSSVGSRLARKVSKPETSDVNARRIWGESPLDSRCVLKSPLVPIVVRPPPLFVTIRHYYTSQVLIGYTIRIAPFHSR